MAEAVDQEKHEKLKEKYNHLKQANSVLKKGLLDKQEEYARLEQQFKDKESVIRQQLEEIDQLQLQNSRMTKQVKALSDQVEELQKNKGGTSAWSVGGMLGGKQAQEAAQKAEGELRVLRDELVMKIQENEDLHMQIYETKRGHEEVATGLRESCDKYSEDLEIKTKKLEENQKYTADLSKDKLELQAKIVNLEGEMSRVKSQLGSLEKVKEQEMSEAMSKMNVLSNRFASRVPFDSAEHEQWNSHNRRLMCMTQLQLRDGSLQTVQETIREACERCRGVLQIWAKAFSQGGDEEPAKRLRIRAKMSDTANGLAASIDEVIPDIVEGIRSCLAPDAGPPQMANFKPRMKALLVTHKRWVVYQSLLLLHNPNDAYGRRTTQEEARTQSFVDSLWRLHQQISALFLHLRLFALALSLTTRNGSGSHFDLVRKALGQKQGIPKVAGKKTQDSGALILRITEKVRESLVSVAKCWEGLSKCLSSRAAAQYGTGGSSQDGTLELLESVHKLCACVNQSVMPAVDKVLGVMPLALKLREATGPGGSGVFFVKAAARLGNAPMPISFIDATDTRERLGQSLAQIGRLSSDLTSQRELLQEATTQKAALGEELHKLQDAHALLQMNMEAVHAASGAAPPMPVQSVSVPTSAEVAGLPAGAPPAGPNGDPGMTALKDTEATQDWVLNSRQRVLPEPARNMSAQESIVLKQHGFFVDVLPLNVSEAKLATGPPNMEAFEAWEIAVRKVYEQQVRNLQAHMQAADCKAMELHADMRRSVELLKQQEEVKQKLREDVKGKHEQLDSVMEDMATTRKNYDNQLAMLTEHICTLSARLSEKDSSLAQFQSHKVLCGRCGMWNTVGKLLSDTSGMCQTCKGKVLSPG